jgi:hypothetical protein
MAPTESYYRASDGYRSFIDNHLVQGVSPPPARVFGDPGAGNLYFGQTNLDGSAGNNLGPSNHPTHYPRETFYGHRVGVNRDYFNNGSYNACVDAIAADLAKGRVPWKSIALSSPNILWSDFATGTGNTAWASFLSDVDAIGKGPVMITIEHEPNPSTATGKTAADYKAMYVQAKTFTDLYPQILLTPVLTGGNFEITGPRSSSSPTGCRPLARTSSASTPTTTSPTTRRTARRTSRSSRCSASRPRSATRWTR